MPNFRYKARDLSGSLHSGTLAARDERELASRLRERGQFLVEYREAEREGSGGRRRVSREDLILLTIQLATSLDAGIHVLEALENLEREGPESLAPVLADVGEEIQAGASLSEALARHPGTFGSLYTNLVAAGEETGSVADVLFRIAEYLEWRDEIAGQVRQLTTYPAIVLAGVVALVVLLFNFVLPRLLGTIRELDVELTLPTRALIAVSEAFGALWPFLVGGTVALVVAILLLRRSPRGRLLLDRVRLALPVYGRLHRKVALSRFVHNLGILHGAGVGIMRSLEIVETLVGNAVLEREIARARERVEMGTTLSEALAESGQFPGLVLQMVAVGERTGSLEESLEKAREFYDREVPRAVDQLFSILEPALIVILGGIVAAVALGIYLPIYNVIQQIG